MTYKPLTDVDHFFKAIELNELEPGVFQNINPSPKVKRTYGGELFTQALLSASRTVDSDRFAHSMHSYFLRPGDPEYKTIWKVTKLRDGRNYSTRRVDGYEHDKLIFTANCNFYLPTNEETYEYSPKPNLMLNQDPNKLLTANETLANVDDDFTKYWASTRSFDIRYVSDPLYNCPANTKEDRQIVWAKAFSNLGDDPLVHQAAFFYCSDYTMLEPGLRSRGIHWASDGLVSASLDHSIWWHRQARADEWFAIVLDLCSSNDGRVTVTGGIYDLQGIRIATLAQEGLQDFQLKNPKLKLQ